MIIFLYAKNIIKETLDEISGVVCTDEQLENLAYKKLKKIKKAFDNIIKDIKTCNLNTNIVSDIKNAKTLVKEILRNIKKSHTKPMVVSRRSRRSSRKSARRSSRKSVRRSSRRSSRKSVRR